MVKMNSQLLVSQRIYFGDIDGDQLDEIIEIDGRYLSVFKCNYENTPILEHVLSSPVKRLVVGDFVKYGREKKKDQIFTILEDGSIRGWAISDDLKEMWWWFTQPNFIQDTEHFIVGDFDGDGADEIMVYEPSTGIIKLYEHKSNGFIGEMSGYSLGNLSGADLKDKLLLAGNFGQTVPRKDILVIDRTAGQVRLFASVTEPNGTNTFWWAFTSNPYLFSSNDELIIANINDSNQDGLIVRNWDTGQYKLFQVEYNNGNLVLNTSVDVGQLPVKPKEGRIAAVKAREGLDKGVNRNDIVWLDDNTCEFIRTDARFDANHNRFTYWWAYTSYIAIEPLRIPERKPWAILLCRFKGLPGDPRIEKFFREIFTPGAGGLIEYWHDASLGAIDISDSRVFGWIELDLERKDAAKPRRELIDIAIAAAQRAGIDPITGFHSQIAVFTHNFSKDWENGEPPLTSSTGWEDPYWGRFWLDGSSINGQVSAPPHMHYGSTLAHEMGHGFGFDEDRYPDLKTNYGDWNCIMSAMRVGAFNHPRWNVAFGPTMSFSQLAIKNWMLWRRVLTINPNWVNIDTETNFLLASMSDRKINASIGVILPKDDSNDSWEYYLEYQRSIGWNREIPPRLVIRRRIENTSAYLGHVDVPYNLGDKADFIEPSGSVKFEVEKIRDDGRMIKVVVSKIR